ncbi:MAG: DUF2332 domain-containing protein [Myxococcota bacterium]|jgi:hypothetical protein|nr:DUF2332 domain-containing protein [Myxococcota bacterium]
MPTELLRKAVDIQLEACQGMDTPFYAGLFACAHAAADDDGLPFWSVMAPWQGGNPIAAALPLRLLGAIHDLILAGRAPDLAAHYPSEDHSGNAEAAWPILNATIEREREFVAGRLDDGLQTNEVRRCAVLLPGFFEIHRRSGGMPMHLGELGASSGLNLCWDRYRYELGSTTWGDDDAPLTLATKWSGAPAEPEPLRVLSRRGCDIAPIDLSVEANRRRLMSFVWPEQPERMKLLARAIDVARREPIDLVKQSAGDFVDAFLSQNTSGAVRVLYHSVMWVYVPRQERERITRTIRAAGAEATADAPIAWLRMEHAERDRAALWLDFWPGAGEEPERLAHCHYHALEVEWFGA